VPIKGRKDMVLNTELAAGVYIIKLQGEGLNKNLQMVIN
jgi:hypothetical protein